MSVLLWHWLPLIFVQCLVCSYVVKGCDAQPQSAADCNSPQTSAPPVLPTRSLSNYPLDPWIPNQVVPSSPMIPWMPRQLIPPPSPPALFGTPLLPGLPRQLFLPTMGTGQSNTPAQIVSPPFSPGDSSYGSFPQTPQQQSDSSYSFRELEFGQQPFLFQGKSSTSTSRAKAVGTAVGVTLAITTVAAGVSICLILRFCKHRRRDAKISGITAGTAPSSTRAGGGKNLKGLIVDEKGQDMVYWRMDNKANDKARKSLPTEAYDLYKERVRKEKDNIQLPSAPTLEVNHPSKSPPSAVRFKLSDKKPPLNDLALQAATEARLPPLVPSGRKGLSKHTDGKENLKPLQREKVCINVDHSKTWGKRNGGSLSYDGDLMEAMFGCVAINRRTSESAEDKHPATLSNVNLPKNLSTAQIFLLDPRRSQYIASILQSVNICREELLDALNEGKGLTEDILEKLSRTTPTKREESLILTFSGHPPNLAHAESYLYHIMKSVPLAFPRLNAMLFRFKYRTEIWNLEEHVRTLEKGCHELRESALLFKLIKTALRAGNEMNAGPVNGSAHSFNLTSLWKLFDIQSLDGKNTIIQSVVEGVAVSEGKQCVMDRDNRLNLSGRNMDSPSSLSKQNTRKFMILGLPLVSSLSAEFLNVKKAAALDYYTYFLTASSTLAAGLNDIRATVHRCKSRYNDGGFVTEMRTFLDKATQELSEKTEEQIRVMQLVKRTTEYYQSGAPTHEDASPFQLFSIMKEYLDKVDQACKHLSENLHRRKTNETITGA